MRREPPTPADRPTVLIVDDNADKLVALESVLLTLDVNLMTAQSGREALRRLLERDFAVVLLDVRMPGMDGFETAALIRERQRSANTPIIFITAFTEETHVAKGYSLRAVDYIMAPVVPEVLRTKVSVLVELFRATAEVRRQAESLRRRTAQLHQLTLASLAINSAESIAAMIAIATRSAVEILDVDLAAAVAHVEEHRAEHVSGAGRRNGGEPLISPVGPEVRRTNGTVRMVWEHPSGERHHGLGIPLIGRTGVNIGSIEVARGISTAFDQEDEDLLVQLAQMTSIAIENAVFAEAREANRLKDEFISAVSHELRTPLNALRSWAWVLRQHRLPAEKIGTVAEAIERSVAAQARIIDDLLDVSRIMMGKMSLRLEPLDLGPIAAAGIEALASLAEGQAVRIVSAIEPVPVPVAGDGDRLQQVVTNLLSNAIKFTPPGGCVEVRLDVADRRAVLRVSDTGCGIAPGFLPHVFERFRQADGSVTRRAGGLGVGLTIVRQLVEMHGGNVTAHSDGEGLGATFTVALPLLEEAHSHTPEIDAAAQAVTRLDGARLLLVEDDPDTSRVMSLVLSEAGASVTTAACADEAMRRLAAEPFDAMLCDIGLPGEDGYSLIQRARALAEPLRRMPALALSAFARDRDRQRARDAGFDGHLAKPIDPATLLQVLTEALAHRSPDVATDMGAATAPADQARIA
jgi:signal transduction histidine kinase/DNA-binding response OmpR family regulator